ncbi:hypothetical protein RCC89_12170 [Cytophagaceae bacterium ABcell3]|nr:hypothetical protein RCC89_12170 [Cytophagaceae bacterium ABcell3]
MKLILLIVLLLLITYYFRKKVGPAFKKTFYFTAQLWGSGLVIFSLAYFASLILTTGFPGIAARAISFIPSFSLMILYSAPFLLINTLLNYLLTPYELRNFHKLAIPANSFAAASLNFLFIYTIENRSSVLDSLYIEQTWLIYILYIVSFLLSAGIFLKFKKILFFADR